MAKTDPELVTFGCRLNTYESEVMRTHARNAGIENAIIFNTCSVTKEAERQARQAIRRARRENPEARIIVTGCAAQIDPHGFGAMPEVDQVIGNDLKLKPETWGAPSEEKIIVNDIMAVKETASHLVDGFEGHTRAFLQVQNGCDHRCTFCIIPYGRGNSRSVPIGAIVDQVRHLVGAGYKEIVFTGVDVTSYGHDLPGQPTLGQMMRRMLALAPELPRVRLSSLDPVEIDDDLWHLIEHEPRLMPHLHLSLQAGDDMILKRMKRRHLRQDVIDVCRKARALRPEIAFGADVIAGFPTETEDMFANTLKIVEECDLTFLHVFPYSEREGTPAARMPQIDPSARKERAARLRELGDRQLHQFMRSQLNRRRQVIVEQNSVGRTEHFAEVHLDFLAEQGCLHDVMITRLEGGRLYGERI
ncbi:MAG: tRNA (N(6)-L-threonylcarbamoyladenosine(37)-C(2))-methylthiotransferase MtaB [Micavibrio aeruginosavorus]|uniref:tRNA (N(6)-L-threonylcarbamoyladenosine(37)-C(2))-methylthiotransferase MtaB n=1 Tax=Micavibrio aeruginosavorus TaxID=349221 RepID=A0A7T5R186_9BACT|nr:MAG: tRNA (N(6)-L-threonylcarbamoyladenosine(37)-C(2))-methylthiotransferase MtaB [Micavibrio aeruginosavorus]